MRGTPAPVDVLEPSEGEQGLRLLLRLRRHGPAAQERVDGAVNLVLGVRLPPVARGAAVVIVEAAGVGARHSRAQGDAAPRHALNAAGKRLVLHKQVVSVVGDHGAVGHAVHA